jgi:hypothetical protein
MGILIRRSERSRQGGVELKSSRICFNLERQRNEARLSALTSRTRSRLIFCGLLDVIDDENIHGLLLQFELQAKLLLKRGEE